jgi:protein gp37
VSDHSKIEWTDATWNPVRGCKKISPGCKHCYAEAFAERFRGVAGHPYEQGFDVRLIPEKLSEPLTWSRPRFVFVNSMSDLFQEDVEDDYILAVAEVMATANWHTYQVLTKRAERMSRLLKSKLRGPARLPHIWWGVSVEDKRNGVPRISRLRESQASTTFLSIEPLIEDLGSLDLSGIDWVIVGGESGPRSRPMERAWVESIRRQCQSQRIPFFFKQWGGVRKKEAGRQLNGRTYNAMPPRSQAPLPERSRRLVLAADIERRAIQAYGGRAVIPARALKRA